MPMVDAALTVANAAVGHSSPKADTMSQLDDLLTTAETAAILGIKLNTLEIWRGQGKGPTFVKMVEGPRGAVRYRRSDVMAWIENRIYASTSAYTAALHTLASVPKRVTPKRIAPAPAAPLNPPPNAPWLKSNA
jgi:predicted DNA-binding transcriptional regulator AlpA